MSEADGNGKVNPFVVNLSILNVVFSFALTIFSFTIILYLKQYGENVLYAGYGLSAGEAVMLLTLLPQGRLIDRGFSFSLMVVGSVVFGVSMIFLYYVVTNSILTFLLIPVLITLLIVFQSTFRTSLNSFLAKAVSSKVLGQNYARILTMETIGTAAAFGIFAFASYYSYLNSVYILPGIFLVVLAILVFSVLSTGFRSELQKEESKNRRPGLAESFRGLASKKDFLAPLISSKVFMTIGVLGFTYFYIPTGLILGLSPLYTSMTLLATYILAAAFGRMGEKAIDRRQGLGKTFITAAMAVDIVTFGLIFFSLEYHVTYTFILAALISSPGTLLVSGAMSYEATVIGRENRGMFGAVQRAIVGAVSIGITLLLTYLYINDTLLLWEFVFASSLMAFGLAMLIPSRYKARVEAATA